MSAPPVHHIDVRAFRYATEVPERVEAALQAVYPYLDDEAVEVDRSTTEGHFGNPIEVLAFALTKAEQFRTVMDRLAEPIGTLEADLEDRVTEDCDLFVRLDKQRAYREGRLALGRGIELRIRLEAYPARPEAAIENFRAYLAETAVTS